MPGSSFLKTIKKLPPSDKDQQFKDGVLWADCVELLKSDDVLLVCKDKAFYENREYARGLARNLQAERAEAGHTLKIYPELKDLLKEIKSDVPINDDDLSAAFLDTFGESVNNMLTRNHFELGPRLSVQKTLYATEQPNQLSIEFTIEHKAIDLSDEARTDGRSRLRGDGTYDAESSGIRFATELRREARHRKWATGLKSRARTTLLMSAPLCSGTERSPIRPDSSSTRGIPNPTAESR